MPRKLESFTATFFSSYMRHMKFYQYYFLEFKSFLLSIIIGRTEKKQQSINLHPRSFDINYIHRFTSISSKEKKTTLKNQPTKIILKITSILMLCSMTFRDRYYFLTQLSNPFDFSYIFPLLLPNFAWLLNVTFKLLHFVFLFLDIFVYNGKKKEIYLYRDFSAKLHVGVLNQISSIFPFCYALVDVTGTSFQRKIPYQTCFLFFFFFFLDSLNLNVD